MNILDIKIEENDAESVGIGGSFDNVYNTAYYNKMSKKAACYEAMGDYEKAIETFTQAEQTLGKDNVLSNKIYAEHLDYIYTFCESNQQDPTKWASKLPDKLQDILAVYEEGSAVKDIDSNKTWKKRKETMELLASGSYNTEEDTDDQTGDGNDTMSSDEEMGE